MYSENKTIQVLIALLKKHGATTAVLSAGTRNVPFVHSVEKDPDFNCHSIVDERSAAYFALGLILEKKEPVIISCTSGTASTNYFSAIHEAYEQHLPLIVLTSDRNQYYLGQLEDQQIPQSGMYRDRVKKSVTLPIIKDDKDEWYCRRLVNEALLELDHNGSGPVHINIPTEWGLFAQNFTVKSLPEVNAIKRITLRNIYNNSIDDLLEFEPSKKILVVYGQCERASKKLIREINKFSNKFNCVVAVENISNIECKNSINTSLISRALSKSTFSKVFAPDLVISLNGNYVSTIKGLLKGCPQNFDHWAINEEGKVIDQFKKLSTVFECKPIEFFEFLNKSNTQYERNTYFELWENAIAKFNHSNFLYSDNYAMQEFMRSVPSNSIIHYGNGVAVHISQYYPVDNSITHYCHSGTTTIDGSLSSFIGQASASKKLCFMFIGDLSFFYDMNALWNRYVGNNVRILLYNNEGGKTFHWNAAKEIDTLKLHTSAEHFTSAKGWVESIGFKYLSARDKDEFDSVLNEFVTDNSDRPILFEVFSKLDTDAKILLEYYAECKEILEDSLSDLN